MSREAIAAELILAHARALKMPGLVKSYETLARDARNSKWTYEEYLHEVLAAELASRADSAVRQRIRDARFPELKTLEAFDFGAAEGLDVAQLSQLARCEWVKKAENVILAGPIGTGKTHLAIALGLEAAKSVVVTTNLAFSEWPKVFADDEKLTTALLDRLADRATILTTRGKSFRMRRRTSEASQPTDAKGAPPVAALPPADDDDAPQAASSSRQPAKKR